MQQKRALVMSDAGLIAFGEEHINDSDEDGQRAHHDR
jgi:hypothetical protein